MSGPPPHSGMQPPHNSAQTLPYGNNVQFRGGSTIYDLGIALVEFLKRYGLVEIILASLLIGYFGWIDPQRRKDESEERRALNEANIKAVKEISVDHKEVARELGEKMTSMQMQQDQIEMRRQSRDEKINEQLMQSMKSFVDAIKEIKQ